MDWGATRARIHVRNERRVQNKRKIKGYLNLKGVKEKENKGLSQPEGRKIKAYLSIWQGGVRYVVVYTGILDPAPPDSKSLANIYKDITPGPLVVARDRGSPDSPYSGLLVISWRCTFKASLPLWTEEERVIFYSLFIICGIIFNEPG